MTRSRLSKAFGLHVRRLRQEKGLSQESFAELCDLHRTYIGSIERGEKTPTLDTAAKIAKALGVKLSTVFDRIENG